MPELDFSSLCDRLRESTANLQNAEAWPAEQLHAMSDAGVLGWLIPPEFGGTDISPIGLIRGYQELATACLPSTFVLTQRNGAIQRIVRSENEGFKSELLPSLASDELFATVGISHLTTSRQHWKLPTVRVEQVDAGFILNGDIPWVTGADKADYIVSGGTLHNRKQVLLAINTSAAGIAIDQPAELMALNATRTASVRLNQVFVPLTDVLFKPVEGVMKLGGSGAGAYTTSALAIGHARGALQQLWIEANNRPDLEPIAAAFQSDLESAWSDLQTAVLAEADGSPEDSNVEAMRTRCNSLVLRTTQAYLGASKGAGFVAAHRASQLVREAMFFLVWSCPQPVVMANMRELAGTS